MPKLRVNAFSISLDGFGAGPNQSLENPLGVGGQGVHQWFFPTRTFQKMQGKEGGTTGPDDDFAARDSKMSEPGFSAAICSAPFVVLGLTSPGKVGGAKIPLITPMSSS